MTMRKNSKKQSNREFNNRLLEIMIDRGILATCLMFLLSEITNPEHASKYKLV